MSIQCELLADYQLIHPEKTTFRLKPSNRSRKRRNSSFNSVQYQLYLKSWSLTHSKIIQIVDDLQSGLLLDLITFIKTTTFNFQSSIRQPIPTGVILGASKILNASLATRINEIRNPEGGREYIPIQLSSRTCLTTSSSIKSIVNLLENQLKELRNDDDDESHSNSDEYSNDDHSKQTGGPNDQLARDDVENIRVLYNELLIQYASNSSPPSSPSSSATIKNTTKSKFLSTFGRKLIFLIDDFEGFDSCVLEDLISIFGNLLNQKIPIILVLSINTSADAIHSLLPTMVVFKLRMTPFAVDMSGGAVTSLIQKIFLDPENQFDLSTGVIRALMDGYDRLNKSIDVLISKLKFIHLAYFHTNPLIRVFNSKMMLNKPEEEEEEEEEEEVEVEEIDKLFVLEGITEKTEYVAHHLRLTSSWTKRSKKLLNESSLANNGSGSGYTHTDDKEMFKILIQSYKNRKLSRHLTELALEFLARISSFWSEKERTNEWVLYNIFRPELVNYAGQLCNFIKHSNDETVMNILTSILELSNRNPELEWIENNLVKLSELIEDHQVRKTTAGRAHLINTHEPVLPGIQLFQADRDFSQILSDIYDAFMLFFRKHLGPDSLLDLNEAWTFDDKIVLNQAFHPKYMRQINTSLNQKNKETQEEDEEDGNGVERIRKMYQLYMETNGKMVNLNDWFGAFFQQSSSSNNNNNDQSSDLDQTKLKKKKKKKNIHDDDLEMELEKKFIKSIGDLAFLGIISPCTRKKEHVSKSFFG